MVAPSWNHVLSSVLATRGGISHGGPALEPRVFTCPGHPGGYLTLWPRAGTMRFHVSPPHRGVSNMAVPRVNQMFSRVHAAQGVSNMVFPSWNHVFSRVQATQVCI